jgi:hypothetical protein
VVSGRLVVGSGLVDGLVYKVMCNCALFVVCVVLYVHCLWCGVMM